MNFDDTEAEALFRRDARAWLSANAQRIGSSAQDAPPSAFMDSSDVDAAKAWQAKKADAGYACITWPVDYGGRGGRAIEEVIYEQEEAHFKVPRGFFEIGLGICVPTLLRWASPEICQRYVRPAVRGGEIWCQLFSEPAAGSDLAAIRTRARQDDGGWIVNGQKIWTSGAHYTDFGIVLTRTDPARPKHQGLTMFYVDMRAPGVDVRKLRQASGGSEFNEVFLTDVRIPDAQRLGAPGEGWKVALSMLMNERNMLGGGIGFATPEQILAIADRVRIDGRKASANAAVREKIAEWYVDATGLTLTHFRALTDISKGRPPGPEQSIHKAVYASQAQQMAYFAMDLLGEYGVLLSDHLGPGWKTVEFGWMWGAAMRIAGGTDEILRNIIAERVLGLPGDIRTDKEAPFNMMSNQ